MVCSYRFCVLQCCKGFRCCVHFDAVTVWNLKLLVTTPTAVSHNLNNFAVDPVLICLHGNPGLKFSKLIFLKSAKFFNREICYK